MLTRSFALNDAPRLWSANGYARRAFVTTAALRSGETVIDETPFCKTDCVLALKEPETKRIGVLGFDTNDIVKRAGEDIEILCVVTPTPRKLATVAETSVTVPPAALFSGATPANTQSAISVVDPTTKIDEGF